MTDMQRAIDYIDDEISSIEGLGIKPETLITIRKALITLAQCDVLAAKGLEEMSVAYTPDEHKACGYGHFKAIRDIIGRVDNA